MDRTQQLEQALEGRRPTHRTCRDLPLCDVRVDGALRCDRRLLHCNATRLRFRLFRDQNLQDTIATRGIHIIGIGSIRQYEAPMKPTKPPLDPLLLGLFRPVGPQGLLFRPSA